MQAADKGDGRARTISHVELAAALSLFRRHVACFWPRLKRSHLDAKVLRRLAGLEKFVDFGGSDHAARGQLIRAGLDILPVLRTRFLRLVTATFGGGAGGADVAMHKWLVGERESAWRALALAARGLLAWAATLQEERVRLLAASAPGTALIMLHGVRLPLPLVACASASALARWGVLSRRATLQSRDPGSPA